jgi:hypothetical protein
MGKGLPYLSFWPAGLGRFMNDLFGASLWTWRAPCLDLYSWRGREHGRTAIRINEPFEKAVP